MRFPRDEESAVIGLPNWDSFQTTEGLQRGVQPTTTDGLKKHHWHWVPLETGGEDSHFRREVSMGARSTGGVDGGAAQERRSLGL